MHLYLHDDIKQNFSSSACFDELMALRGESFRQQEGRLTQRVVLNNKSYFIKQHFGVGTKEILKNMLQLRWPITSAKPEWLAIKKLQTLGINVPSIMGFGERGCNPALQQSFILMEDLTPTISLETLCQNWRQESPAFVFKQKLLTEVASIARMLHTNGINHRDFYICHFLLDLKSSSLKLYLIDLHRAQLRDKTPERWIIKDLAGLYFSSKDVGLTKRDLLRFIKLYREKPLRQILNSEKTFWQKVKHRGEQLYRDHSKR